MQSEELKPCPFCGGNNLQFRLSDIEGWIAHVECTDCDDMLGPMSEWKHDNKEDAEKDAAVVWNRRPCLEAALSAAEPVVWQPRYKQEVIDHLRTVSDNVSEYAMTVFPTKDKAEEYGHGGHQVRPLYAAPPAPSVAVKAWTTEDEAREYRSFSEWFKERGYPKYPEHYSLVCENAMHAAWQEVAKRSALSAQVQDVAGWRPKEIATWEDQQAFEAWAQGERYEMHQHPLHYLFMEPKTNAARQGWKAALQFIRDRPAAAPAKQEG